MAVMLYWAGVRQNFRLLYQRYLAKRRALLAELANVLEKLNQKERRELYMQSVFAQSREQIEFQLIQLEEQRPKFDFSIASFTIEVCASVLGEQRHLRDF